MNTIQEAKEKMIYFINENLEVEEMSEYEFIMLSADETTTPRGVGMRWHTRENEETNMIEVWTWGVRGNNPRYLEQFQTIEEADQFIFEKTYEYDFMEDDQRPTWYTENKEEAEEEAKKMRQEMLND